MGLQKIFSATTSVVGLFISVDYGLCDAFRCRGIEVPLSSATAPTTGWQSRAVWTIVYIAGLAVWTLHLSLLEGDVVTSYEVGVIEYIIELIVGVKQIVVHKDQSQCQSQPIAGHRFSDGIECFR